MLNRRLIILFVTFIIGFIVLTLRLVKLQLVDADEWREVVRAFVHRTRPIETYRGAILDRNGQILAQDIPSDELAIDYRAMNLDDRWLYKTALERLSATPAWSALDRARRLRLIDETKVQIADQIRAIPAAIAQACHVPQESVLQRFQEIRARISVLREDLWSQRFDREAAQNRASNGGASTGADFENAALDSAFQSTQLREELIAHTIRSNIAPDVANFFRQHADDFPGLLVRDNANRRNYPFGEATAHVVGTMNSVKKEAMDADPFHFADLLAASAENATPDAIPEKYAGNLGGYLPGDRAGESGAELTLEPFIRGNRGEKLIDLTATGDESAKDTLHIDPVPGRDVRLTVDALLQRDLYDALRDPDRHLLKSTRSTDSKRDHFVAIVVMALNGEVLSLVSYPSYDPNTIDDHRLELNTDRYRTPLINRATSGIYQPGSTVKPLMAAAALSERLITPEFSVNCTGHFYPTRTDIFKCDAVHNDISLVDAISKSCNIYFYTVGQKMGLERLEKWYDYYGFGRDSGLELNEAHGSIPKPSLAPSETNEANSLAMLAGIGQGKIAVTPLQMANAYAILLRGGVIIPPHLIKDNPSVHPARTAQIAPAVLDVVRQGMENCVTTGTAKSTFKGIHLAIAGKTGTAQTPLRVVLDENDQPVDDPARPLLNPDGSPMLKPDGTPAFKPAMREDDDAWFVGYAPADNPKFIVAAIMEWGGHGGTEAAPLAREAFLQLERHDYLPKLDVPQ